MIKDQIEVEAEEVPSQAKSAQKKPASRRRRWWSSWWAIILMAVLLLGSGAMAMVIWGPPVDLLTSKEKSEETSVQSSSKEFEELRQKLLDLEAAKAAEETKRQEEAKAQMAEAESKIKLLEEEAAAKAADAQKLATLLAEAEAKAEKAKAEAETAAKVAGEAVPGDQGLVFVPYDPAKHKVKPGSTERFRHTGEGDMPKHQVASEAVPAKTRDGKVTLVRPVLGPKGLKIEKAGSYVEQAPELEDSSLRTYSLEVEVEVRDPQDPTKTKIDFKEFWFAR